MLGMSTLLYKQLKQTLSGGLDFSRRVMKNYHFTETMMARGKKLSWKFKSGELMSQSSCQLRMVVIICKTKPNQKGIMSFESASMNETDFRFMASTFKFLLIVIAMKHEKIAYVPEAFHSFKSQ